MATLNQLVKNPRKKVKNYCRTKFLNYSPQKKGVCVKIYTTKPKKPHSAIRKVAKLYLPSRRRFIISAIPGQSHNLSTHSIVLIRGGRVRDLPGIHSKLVRNKLDFTGQEVIIRKRRRSKYGLKNLFKH